LTDIEFAEARAATRAGVWEASVPVVPVVSGLGFAEGPLWHPREHHLTFSDIPGNSIARLAADGELTILVSPSNHANGNAYDGAGRLVTCEHATSRVVRRDRSNLTVLADRWEGRELNSPNDVVVARNGAVFFTDPPFGRRMRSFGGKRPIPQKLNGVYRLDADGLSLMAGDFDLPNGLCLSPDQRTVFVADTARCHIRRFEIAVDGSWHGGEVWADVPSDGLAAPDGLKCDSAGNIFCSGLGGVHIFDPAGAHIECIPVPELVANFSHGGADLQTLFIAASTSIYRARVTVAGLPAF
jgi:gluconolactonase